MKNSPILKFQDSYIFLSNFWVEPDGTHVEGEYQRAKCANPLDQLRFSGLTPGQSKRLGQVISIRTDWERVKLIVMHELVQKKFHDHKSLATLLKNTGERDLIEGNHWGDRFWGKL